MKVPAEVIDTWRAAIAPLDTEDVRATYRARDIPRADAVKDLDKRYRWDLWHASGGWRLLPEGHDYNDAHIDTALRQIVPAL